MTEKLESLKEAILHNYNTDTTDIKHRYKDLDLTGEQLTRLVLDSNKEKADYQNLKVITLELLEAMSIQDKELEDIKLELSKAKKEWYSPKSGIFWFSIAFILVCVVLFTMYLISETATISIFNFILTFLDKMVLLYKR